jgi:cytochrome P450
MWTLHRDARFFDEPDEFRPHRWADGLAERLPRFAYLPFGGGPRQCIGSSFALMEAILVLATIAQRFRLTLAPGEVVETWVAPTVRPKGDLRMVVEHR